MLQYGEAGGGDRDWRGGGRAQAELLVQAGALLDRRLPHGKSLMEAMLKLGVI